MRVAAAAAAALVLLAACSKQVPQDADTGDDGDWKGAEELALEGGIATAEDQVSYPAGDRIDWHVLALGARRGTVTVELAWEAPRPGLDLAFQIWTEHGGRVAETASGTPRSARERKKSRRDKRLSVTDATGNVWVRVYASRRPDAGRYELTVTFQEERVLRGDDLEDVLRNAQVPYPPALPAVYPPCNEAKIDPENPDCLGKVPDCDPARPVDTNPKCRAACDTGGLPADSAFCKAVLPPVCPDRGEPRCPAEPPPPPEPIVAQAKNRTEVQGGTEVLVILDAEKVPGAALIDRSWTVELANKKGAPVAKSAGRVHKVEPVGRQIKVTAFVPKTPDQVLAAGYLRFAPPAP